jgi:hypothetical protein
MTSWLVAAIISAIGAFNGGDTSIVCGWIFLLLTFPFWLAWQTYAYEFVTSVISKDTADVVGIFISISAALLAWWHVIPIALKRARARSPQ